MIPISVQALESLGLGELVPGTVARSDHRPPDRLSPRSARRSLRRHSRRARVRRRRARSRRHDARSERRVRGDGDRRRSASRQEQRSLRRHHRLDGQDVDEGHPRCALRAGRAHGRERGQLQRRARRPAHARPAGAGHGDLHRGDGHARLRSDRGALQDRPAGHRRGHRDRARAPRARRIGRRCREVEGGARSRSSRGWDRGRAGVRRAGAAPARRHRRPQGRAGGRRAARGRRTRRRSAAAASGSRLRPATRRRTR